MFRGIQIQGPKEELVQMAAPVGVGSSIAAPKSLLRNSIALLG